MEAFFSTLAEGFDLPILDWIASHLSCKFFDIFMPAVTVLGDSGIFWILLAVFLLFFPKYRKAGLSMGAALLIGLVVCNITLKPLAARIRPYDYQFQHFGKEIQLLIPALHDFSFPSGHSAASFEGATVLMLYDKKLGIPAMILAALIAFSRLYLYVHYPTDVIFGILIGVGAGFLGTYLVKKAYGAYENKHLQK